MKGTCKPPQPALHIKARSDGWVCVFDKDQRLRYKARTADECKNWLAAELTRQHPPRQAALFGETNSP